MSRRWPNAVVHDRARQVTSSGRVGEETADYEKACTPRSLESIARLLAIDLCLTPDAVVVAIEAVRI